MTTQTDDLRFGGSERGDRARPDWANWRTEEQVMKWYGWGSAVGLSILLVSVGVCAVLLRYAFLGG